MRFHRRKHALAQQRVRERAHWRRARRARRTGVRRLTTRVALSLTVSAALLGGVAAQTVLDRAALAQHERAVFALAHDNANRARSDVADGARLDGKAIMFAGITRRDAVAVAQTAVAVAKTVVASSSADVAPAAMTPLDNALASLAALIEMNPVAPAPVAAVPAVGPANVPTASAVPAPVVTAPIAPAPAPVAAASTPPAPQEASSAEAALPVPAGPLDPRHLEVSAQMVAAAALVTDL